jgi:hypothetical protein
MLNEINKGRPDFQANPLIMLFLKANVTIGDCKEIQV